MNNERQRTPNFSESEIKYLIELVKRKKDIIECKKTDNVSAERKNKCWKDIASEFNSQNNSPQFRNDKVLRKKYENLKRDLKKRSANLKIPLNEIASEPLAKVEAREVDDNLQSILLEKQITGVDNLYNNDLVVGHDNGTCEAPQYDGIKEELLLDDPDDKPLIIKTEQDVTPEVLQSISGEGSWNNYNHNKLRTVKAKKRLPFKATDPKSSWSQLATIKANCSEEKHKIEIRFLEEEHQQRMINMQKEHQMKQEKHELEMEILRYELEQKKQESKFV